MKLLILVLFLVYNCKKENLQNKNIQIEKSIPIYLKSYSKGVQILRNNQNLSLYPNLDLTKLDEIKTNTGSFLELDLLENTGIKVYPNSNLRILSESSFELLSGSYLLNLPLNKKFSELNILSEEDSILLFQINTENKRELFVLKGKISIPPNHMILREKTAILINSNLEKINFSKIKETEYSKSLPSPKIQSSIKKETKPIKPKIKLVNKENPKQEVKESKPKKENLDELLKLNPNSEFE